MKCSLPPHVETLAFSTFEEFEVHYAKNYDFLVVNNGIDKRSSMLRNGHRRRSSAASRAFHRGQRSNGAESPPEQTHGSSDGSESSSAPNREAENPTNAPKPERDADIDELASTMSALKFVPPSVRFGRGGRRGGLSRS
ncbi:hypothetical protein P7C71_g842, partial [Lecanoromycetidae sp. Uapishka_2]